MKVVHALYGISVLASVKHEVSSRRLSSTKSSIAELLHETASRKPFKDAAEGKKGLISAWTKFKVHLAVNQTRFVERCAAANAELEPRVSCGATMECFIKLFVKDFDKDPLNRYFQQDITSAMTAIPGGDSMEGHLRPVLQVDELLRTEAGQRMLRALGMSALERLVDELVRDDDDNELPRLFIPFLTWNVLVDGFGKMEWMHPKSTHDDFLEALASWFAAQVSKDIVPVVKERFKADSRLLPRLFGGILTHGMPAVRVQSGSEQATMTSEALVDFCRALQGEQECSMPRDGYEPVDAVSCPCLFGKRQGVLTPQTQNHIFAIVKHSNKEANQFSVLQGYVGSYLEPGYDLRDWLCSRNKFASIKGFGRATLARFVDHLSNFLAHSSGGGTFDGENHAATFLVREKSFEGKRYYGFFNFMEIAVDDVGPDHLVKQMVTETTPVDEGGLFRLNECTDMNKVHDGKLRDGEDLRLRPGSLPSLDSTQVSSYSDLKDISNRFTADFDSIWHRDTRV